jgi:diguanylate cyclase (GGDEF)-like protein
MKHDDPLADGNETNVFSAQLNKGFRHLTFALPLETKYRRIMREEQRKPAILCTSVSLAIWIAFGISDVYRMGGWHQFMHGDSLTWVVLAARWTALIGLILSLLYLKRGGLHYDRLNLVVYMLIGIAVGITSNIIKANGSFAMGSSQILIVMAAFLPIGLTFWQALAAALLVTISGITTSILIPVSDTGSSTIEFMVMLPLATLVAALGGYAREYARREQFLLRGILRLQASTDALTALANRCTFVTHATLALKQSVREKQAVLLAIIDIDNFKRYNDHYGHSEGDITLQRVAATLQQAALRPMDMAARVGGEEFAIILCGISQQQATHILEQTRQAVQAMGIEHSATDEGIVTISVGVAIFDGHESLDDLYRRADTLLYQAKHGGRNRVCYDNSTIHAINNTYELATQS